MEWPAHRSYNDSGTTRVEWSGITGRFTFSGGSSCFSGWVLMKLSCSKGRPGQESGRSRDAQKSGLGGGGNAMACGNRVVEIVVVMAGDQNPNSPHDRDLLPRPIMFSSRNQIIFDYVEP